MREPIFVTSGLRLRQRVSHATRRMLWLALLLVLPVGAQNGPLSGTKQTGGTQGNWRTNNQVIQFGDGDAVEDERRLRLLNAERQKSMISDAGKLLKLAGELETEVTNARTEALTPAELHKVGEIEKLARNVKEKMSFSVRGSPVFREPPAPPAGMR